MPSKSSPLDVLPTSLLKFCSATFSVIIADLANMMFRTGQFPNRFETAQIMPLLKNNGLYLTSPASYRPVSNLNTTSKVLERLILSRITAHLDASGLVDCLQSAYRKCHSTETALLRITDDVYRAFDADQSVIVVALDLSAAFDCTDHSILISRLQYTYSFGGHVLDLIKSYLSGGSSFVKWIDTTSECSAVDIGVPQGTSLSPLLFSMYILPLVTKMRSFGVMYHQYADDTQIYIVFFKSRLYNVQIKMLE